VASLHPDRLRFQRFMQEDQTRSIVQKIAGLAAMSSASPGV